MIQNRNYKYFNIQIFRIQNLCLWDILSVLSIFNETQYKTFPGCVRSDVCNTVYLGTNKSLSTIHKHPGEWRLRTDTQNSGWLMGCRTAV